MKLMEILVHCPLSSQEQADSPMRAEKVYSYVDRTIQHNTAPVLGACILHLKTHE